jgi:hypothetical protein
MWLDNGMFPGKDVFATGIKLLYSLPPVAARTIWLNGYID